jgi:hypothetical protein
VGGAKGALSLKREMRKWDDERAYERFMNWKMVVPDMELCTLPNGRPRSTFIAAFAGVAALALAVPAHPGAESDLPLPGPYLGQTPPSTTPELFAPGILSTALHDDGPAKFNVDGTEVYFRKWAVPHDIVGTMRLENGQWTQPALFKPMGKYVVSAPIFSTDGQSAFFISRRPLRGDGEPADYNVWVADRTPDGWGELSPLGPEVNTPDDEMLYSVSARGTLYFQGRKDDSLGGYDIYASEIIDGEYQPAANLGPPLNTEHSEAGPFVAPDESFLVYCVRGHPDGLGGLDLYVAFKKTDGTWGPGLNLGPGVNTAANEKFPALTLDGKYLFFVGDQGADRSYVYSDMTYAEAMQRNLGPMNGEGDVYWVSAEVIERVRPDN